METTQCVVAGGGPAGMMLGLLLARTGVDVAVLEKHADFLRDFRGDTVHASTLGLLDNLGLGERFAALPHRREPRIEMIFDKGRVVQDFTRLPGRHQHIALVPQWDFLGMLAEAATASPRFTLRMSAEVQELIRDGDQVRGVRYLDRSTGQIRSINADLVIGCDGRTSTVRDLLKLVPKQLGTPFDCLYIPVPRLPGDPDTTLLRFSAHGGLIMVNRNDYWQAALLIGKGQAQRALAKNAFHTRAAVTKLAPYLASRIAKVPTEDIATLEIRLDRLDRWWRPGALCIGDAAHAMSPIAGVGINLAIQDAVATARILGPKLRAGTLSTRDLAAVQRRRRTPAILTQAMQRAAQREFVPASFDPAARKPLRAPASLRMFGHLLGRVVAIGLRPEMP